MKATRRALSAVAGKAPACDANVRTASSLFVAMRTAPTLDNAERLAHWLGSDPAHVRALDIALTEWGLVQSGHPVGDARGEAGNVR